MIYPFLWEFQGTFGQFYHYSPLVITPGEADDIYMPRMKIFKGIDKDEQTQEYIRRDGRIMYMADAAIAPDLNDYASILASGLDRQVVQVEAANLEKVQDFHDLKLQKALPENFIRHDYLLPSANAQVHKKPEGIEYQWALPKDFPRYLATNVFTPDMELWHLNVGPQQLTVVQGDLVYPLTFDVNNVRDGYVTVLMPEGMPIGQEPVELHVWTSSRLVDVWRNAQDEFGFTYNNPRSGWWVMHMPYDPKWQLFIDGVKTPLSKVNRYFIGAPLSAGEHRILLTYWPNSPLRPLIILSVLTAFVIIFIIFRWTYQWYRE